MGILSAITKMTIDVASLPVAITKDVLSLGGTITDKDTTYTEEKINQIKKDSEDADDSD